MPTPTIPSAPPSAVDQMTDVAYRRYLHDLGGALRHCRNRFVAELPSVARRDLAPRWGYGSVYEFASKIAGIRKPVVDEILRLHDALGKFKRLWTPLREGTVGWTKLKTIRKWVTPETVGWWARKLRECSRRQLEDEVRRLEAAQAQAQVHGQVDAEAGAGPLRASTDPGGSASSDQARSRSTDLPGQGLLHLAGAASTTSPDSAPPPDSVPGQPGNPHPDGISARRGGTPAAQPQDPRLVIHPSHEEMVLLEALRRQLELEEGRTLTYDQVVRRAIHQAALGAEEAVGTHPSKPPTEPTTRPAAKPPIHALLVLYRNVDTGELRIPTRRGLEPVDPDAYHLVAGEARPVYLPDLLHDAAATDAKPGTRYVPVSHQLLVAARHGNRCAFPECFEAVDELHHLTPLSEGGRSEAENLVPTCALHHDALHSGWVEGRRAAIDEWTYAAPGEEPPGPGEADQARRRYKRRASPDSREFWSSQ